MVRFISACQEAVIRTKDHVGCSFLKLPFWNKFIPLVHWLSLLRISSSELWYLIEKADERNITSVCVTRIWRDCQRALSDDENIRQKQRRIRPCWSTLLQCSTAGDVWRLEFRFVWTVVYKCGLNSRIWFCPVLWNRTSTNPLILRCYRPALFVWCCCLNIFHI
jgi:hypothetical protein